MARWKIAYEVTAGGSRSTGSTVHEADTIGEALFEVGVYLGAREENMGITLLGVYREAGWVEVELP